MLIRGVKNCHSTPGGVDPKSTALVTLPGWRWSKESKPFYLGGVDPRSPVGYISIIRTGRVLALGPLPVTAGTVDAVALPPTGHES